VLETGLIYPSRDSCINEPAESNKSGCKYVPRGNVDVSRHSTHWEACFDFYIWKVPAGD